MGVENPPIRSRRRTLLRSASGTPRGSDLRVGTRLSADGGRSRPFAARIASNNILTAPGSVRRRRSPTWCQCLQAPDEYLVCRVCGHGLHVAHASAVEGMRAATLLFREGRITEPDYRARTDRFWQSMGVALEAGTSLRPRRRQGVPAPSTRRRSKPPLPTGSLNSARLRAEGILTDDEFGAAKRHLIGGADQRGTQARQEGTEGQRATRRR